LSTKKENTVLQMEMLTKNVGKITNAWSCEQLYVNMFVNLAKIGLL
jgi:hypothetical protein